MAATIDIIGVDGSSNNVIIESASVRRFELMKEDYIRLVFSSDKKINIRLGDSITHELWGTFYITEAQKPTYNRETGGYDYDLQFNAPYYKWNNKLYKFEPKTNRNEASWSLTDNLKNHMAVFLRNLEHYGWHYTVDAGSYELEEAARTVFIQFDNVYILDALAKIAEAFKVEWWITDNIIHLGRVESGTAIDFEVGVNVENMDAQSSEKDAITRFYAFGSTQNIPSGYRKNDEQVLLNGVVQKRVMLPADTPYIDIEQGLTRDEIVEGIVIFDDVYPRTKSKISEVIEVEKTVEKNNSTKEATTDTDTTPAADEETEKVKIYRFKTEDFTFSENYILAGQTLQVKFESGNLNGMTFDLAFNPEGKSEKITVKDGDGTKEIDNPEAQLFEIVRNETYGLMLPNETLKPSAKDMFVLLGWDANKMEVWKELIEKAEDELKEKAEAFAEKKKIDPLTYPCTMMADYMYGLNNGQQDPNYSKVGTFPLGQRIRLNNAVYFNGGSRVSRVVGFEYKLDIPYDGAVIIVGESSTYSSSRATEAAINAATDSINYRGGEFSSTGGKGNVYIITSNDATAPSEGNVYSALRSDRQYARKNRNDNISSLWTFKNRNGMRNGLQTEDYNGNGANEDNLFGKGFELISKPDGNGGFKTKMEVDELFVRIKAFFARLEIREISYVGGNYCFSAAGSKIYYVEWLDAQGKVIDKKKGNISDVAIFRCYLYSDDGTTATINKWAVDDQVMCRTFNIDEGVHEGVSNKYYWRRATGIGRGIIISQVKEEIILEDGDEIVETNNEQPTEYQYVDISMDDCATNSDYPEAEDTIVQFGNWSNEKRQGIIYLMVEGDSAPAIMEYSGVGANGKHFVLPDPSLLLSPKKNVIYGEFHSVVDSGGSTGSGDSIDDQLRALIDALNDIKNQADKKMEMWFGAYEPLPTKDKPNKVNYPASEWTTDALKALHAQDLFYDTLKAPATQRGRAWRWIASLDENNNVIYYWEDVTDQDTIDALEKIADVASDGKLTGGAEKTRVFIDWQKAVQEYLKYKEQAHDYGITTELTDYVTAFKALGKLLNDGNDLVTSDTMTIIPTPSWLADLGTETVIPSPTDYREKWNNYYTTLAALLKEITKKAKELADAAQKTADEAIDLIGDIASDGRLDPSEKITIKREFTAAFHEKNDTDEAGYKSGILDRASYVDEYGIKVYIIDYQNIIIPYINAFVNVGTYLNGGTDWQEPTLANFGDATLPVWLKSANMKNTEDINADTFRNIWNTFYSRRTAVLTALSEHAQNTADDAHDRIDDVVSDGILSGGAEKTRVYIDWMKAVEEYWEYKERAEDYEITTEWSDYNSAFLALARLLNGDATLETNQDGTWKTPAWLQDLHSDTSIPSPSTYRQTWNGYYAKLAVLLQTITKKAKELADAAQETADEAIQTLTEYASDGYITPDEKLTVKREFIAAFHEMNDSTEQGRPSGIIDQAKDENGNYIINASIVTIYVNAYKNVGKYLNGGTDWNIPNTEEIADAALPSWLQAANMTRTENIATDSARASWLSVWENFYSSRTAVLTALTEKAQDTANGAHDRIDDIVSDGVISAGSEKSLLYINWLKTIDEYNKYIEQASDYFGANHDKATALTTAYKKLAAMLDGQDPATQYANVSANILNGTTRPTWLTASNINVDTILSETTINGVAGTPDAYRDVWKGYHMALTDLLEAITAKAKELADNAQETADNAVKSLEAIASDNKIDKAEIAYIKHDFISMLHEFWDEGGLKDQACDEKGEFISYSVSNACEDTEDAMKAIGKFLNGGTNWSYITVLDIINGVKEYVLDWEQTLDNLPLYLNNTYEFTEPITIDGEEFVTLWGTYYKCRASILGILSDEAHKAADDADQKAQGAQDEIDTITSDGILSSVEKKQVRKEWEEVVRSFTRNSALATIFDVSSSDYGTDAQGNDIVEQYSLAYAKLGNYLDGCSNPESTSEWTWTVGNIPKWLAYLTETGYVDGQGMGDDTEIVPATYRSYWVNYYDLENAVLNAISEIAKHAGDEALAKLEEIADDGVITPSEKNTILIQWLEIAKEFPLLVAQADAFISDASGATMVTSLTNAKNTYVTRFNTLANYLNNGDYTYTLNPVNIPLPLWIDASHIGNSEELSTSQKAAFKDVWENYFSSRTSLQEVFAEASKEPGKDALGELDNLADDDILTPFEKLTVLREWDAITVEKTDLLSKAATAHVSTSDYVLRYNVLGNYLNDPVASDERDITTPFSGTPAALLTDGNTTIRGSQFKSNWSNFYNERTKLLSAISTSKVSYFVSVDVPTPPYHVGDIWMRLANSSDTKGKMYICVVDNETSTGRLADWADMSDITEKRDPRILIAALVNMVYAYSGGYIREKGNNAYEMIYLGTMPNAGHAQGDLAYANGNVYQYTDTWENISNETLRMSFKALHEIIGDYNIRIFRTRPTITPKLYDIVCSPLTFTDTNLPTTSQYRTVEGGIQIQMYNGTDWEVLQESTHSLIENLSGYVRALAMKSAGDYSTAAGFITAGDWADLFAEAEDADGNKIAQAHLSAYVQKDSNGNIVSGVKIGADQIIVEGKTFTIGAEHIEFKGKTVINGKFIVDAYGNVTMDGFTATNATITGKIIASEGTIGDFNIDKAKNVLSAKSGSLKITPNGIEFRPSNGSLAWVGATDNIIAAFYADMSSMNNNTLACGAQFGATGASNLNAAIDITKGVLSGLIVPVLKITNSIIIVCDNNVFSDTDYIKHVRSGGIFMPMGSKDLTFTLPAAPANGTMYSFIKTSDNRSYTIKCSGSDKISVNTYYNNAPTSYTFNQFKRLVIIYFDGQWYGNF